MICRWAQELLGYLFNVIHRLDCMMANVDYFTRHFVPVISKHLTITDIIRDRDQLQIPKSYVAATFLASKNSKSKIYKT